MGSELSRRTLLACGGAALIGSGAGALGIEALRGRTGHPGPAGGGSGHASGDATIQAGLARAISGALSHFFDSAPAANHIRPTSGGGRDNGLISATTPHPSFWQMECLENALFNEAQRDLLGMAGAMRGRLAGNWTHVRTRRDLTPRALAGDDTDGTTIYTMDDGCLQAMYFMHVHQLTGDTLALGYMVETIVNTCANFLDPDAANNPPVRYAPASPNIPGIDYGLGTVGGAGSGARRGRPFVASRFGSTYTQPGHPNFAQIGKAGGSVESVMAVCALYAHEHLHLDGMRAYAVNIFDLIHDRYLTPDPDGGTLERANVPPDPALRKAQFLVECDLRLDRANANPQDSGAGFLQPLRGFYGKPILSVDSTYLLAATAYCVVGARLHALTGDAEYRRKAVRTANALISPRAYGRIVGGKTLIANTRDPHSDGLMMVLFATEVLTLEGIDPKLRQAFVDTGRYIATSCVHDDGYTSGDWSGPETSVFGTTTWQALYEANPSGQAGRQQIMVTGNTIAMLQAGAIAARGATAT